MAFLHVENATYIDMPVLCVTVLLIFHILTTKMGVNSSKCCNISLEIQKSEMVWTIYQVDTSNPYHCKGWYSMWKKFKDATNYRLTMKPPLTQVVILIEHLWFCIIKLKPWLALSVWYVELKLYLLYQLRKLRLVRTVSSPVLRCEKSTSKDLARRIRMCDVTAKSAKNLTGMAPKEKYIYIEAGIKTF